MDENRDRDKAMRGRLLLLLLVIVPLGFASKLCPVPGADWIQASSGGIFYVMFWMFLVLLIWPQLSPWRVALGVLLVTSALEVMQLWHPPQLVPIRSTLLGQALLGTTFACQDFPFYVVGTALGVVAIRVVKP